MPQSPRVETAAVVTHGRVDVEHAVERVRAVAARAGVKLVDEPREADLAVVLGGDGTILRTLGRLLGTSAPAVIRPGQFRTSGGPVGAPASILFISDRKAFQWRSFATARSTCSICTTAFIRSR